jgi:hypothetical protein
MHMDAGLSPARQARAKHRHELRSLTYVTLDQANGGIVRNVSHEGIGVQVVTAVRPRQQLQVRFELGHPGSSDPGSSHPRSSHPRLRVETRGEVMWAASSGQCGIRFLDLSPGMTRHINEWIFGNLLEGIALHSERAGPMFAGAAESVSAAPASGEHDGLMISATPLKIIELPLRPPQPIRRLEADADTAPVPSSELDWLSQPLSGRSLIWTVNTLVALAALLLFVLVFLSVTREAPQWPLAMMGGAAIFVAVLYWGFFQVFGGSSPGARLARLVGSDLDEDEDAGDDRFR